METWETLLQLLLLLLAAVVLGALAERLKQSAILGYLLAGTLLGPNALKIVSGHGEPIAGEGGPGLVEVMAELGVALLLFSIGLEFSFRRLRQLGPAALGGGTLQVIATLTIGGAVAIICGAALRTAVAVGAIVALSSTACVLRVLMSRAELESVHGRLATGILLVQDLAVVPLVLLLGILGGEGETGDLAVGALRKVIAAAGLIGGFWILFNYIVPWVLGSQLMRRNRELPILIAIVAGLGSAMVTHKLELSASLGAFIVGIILAESPYAVQIRADIASLRTLLLTLFFSTIGMLGDPVWAWHHMLPVAATVAAIVVGKAVIVWIVLRLMRVRHRHGLAAGISLAQAGEFSFVLAAVALTGQLIDEDGMRLLVTATIATLFITPYLVAAAPATAHFIAARLRRAKMIKPVIDPSFRVSTGASREHVIIVGFGPAGQAVGETLLDRGDSVHVLELNHAAVTEARRLGFHGHYGDATHAEVLEHVHAATAAAVVITIPDPTAARQIVLSLRAMSPDIFIIVRARYHLYRWELQHAGADVVLDEEYQLGTHLAAELHYRLGERSAERA